MPTSDDVLQPLVDRADITSALMRYAQAIDRGDLEAASRCFADDATASYEGNDVGPGRDTILAYFKGGARSLPSDKRTISSMHFIGNVLIELDGDVAHVESYMLAHLFRGTDTPNEMLIRGLRYLDLFVRTQDGWQIQHRVHTADWMLQGTPTFAIERARHHAPARPRATTLCPSVPRGCHALCEPRTRPRTCYF